MKLFVGAKGIVVHEGKVLILRESGKYAEGINEGKWDVPGGRIKEDEAFLDGLKREILEESGLSVLPRRILRLAETFSEIKGEPCHIIRIYFECEVVGGAKVILSSDHDAFEWILPVEHRKYPLIDIATDNVHDVLDEYVTVLSR